MLWTSMFLGELDQLLTKMPAIHITEVTTTLHSYNRDLVLDPTIPKLYSDSSGVCTITNDPQHFKRMKHIDIVHFFLWDEVADGHLTIALIQSSENLADILTKPLTAPMLVHLRQLFGLKTPKEHSGSRGVEDGDPADPIGEQMDPS
ncbi:hypothetical protein NDA11_007997 [Ustilago hordei]|uniref:Uncharacterized protein n=1 Tax=Ustilago hordei TaxID=120017 RepID=I2FT81_USTHO|nr:hypothetical protein NDA10_003151 [Ustilago hordei]KAJ1572435.1 hypothetical protein NDA12_001104 [Ustilago hordei]KAJ1576155.1 hypothetical protein NDA15_003287 [Ustilago hordei]KAJ1593939.1 hypothetical protein NDA11_007997 [Ustilago hordei]KAJ1595412.1 hypothetical protein NDA14_004685 [Ustilago hordei]